MATEILIVILIGAVVLGVPLAAGILSILAFLRSRRIEELSSRLNRLEAQLRFLAARDNGQQQAATIAAETAAVVPPPDVPASEARSRHRQDPAGWEAFIGQKAFGWIAVVLFVFSVAFFLRYAYQNNWIGPVGRVAIGELAGMALFAAGWTYHRRGWQRFSAMLTSAGTVVLYLATYSAFGFYRLLPQQHAGVFLSVLVAESMLAAVIYRSTPIALVSVIGGLLTPLLMHSDHDTYSALFTWLILLNTGVVVSLLVRGWPAVGSVAWAGTQGLFWMWYAANYHPDKFAWALGFQLMLFGLYLMDSVCRVRYRRQTLESESLVRFAVNAIVGFISLRVLLLDDYGLWLGSVAIGMAALYAAVGRVCLSDRVRDNRLLLTSLAIAMGFTAWAFTLQAQARWVAVGWAVMSVLLWWFGMRISAASLRLMGAVLGSLSVGRVLMFDLPLYTRDPFIPIFNAFALPSLCVAGCVLFSVIRADRFLPRLTREERPLLAIAGVTGVLLLWLILSFDCYGWFVSQSIGTTELWLWRWRGQLALTVLWTVFATGLLLLGFRLQRSRLRWLAMILYGLAVLKLFVIDMANVQQLYRILAFFVLAMVLGLVARAYQRFK